MKTRGTILTGAVAIALGFSVPTEAQTVLDGAYIKEHTKTQRVVPYPYIREADVMWYRRIWREIVGRNRTIRSTFHWIRSTTARACSM